MAALFTITGVTYAIEQPDRTEPEFLSPESTAPVGASRLADLVRERGVEVQRKTRTSDALVAAHSGDATLLVTVPGVVHPQYLRMLRLLPASTRVVLVDAEAGELLSGRFPVSAAGRRWATGVVAPQQADRGAPAAGAGCALPEAHAAGPAAVLRQRYGEIEAPQLYGCYGNALVGLRLADTELLLVGASDPFRNDRIGEHGNAALATGLLTTRPRVVWLDLHRPEPPPGVVETPGTGDPVPPSLQPGRGEPGPGGDGNPGGTGDGDGRRSERGNAGADEEPPNPLWGAFPPWFWALLVQLAVAALLVALWRARRLGPPVSEPLPVQVRSAETVLGRGRLYHRARARAPALDILRSATRARLGALLDLPPDAGEAGLVGAVAAQTGRSEEEVDGLLYGAAPESDDDLVRMAGELDALLHAVGGPPSHRAAEGPRGQQQARTPDEGEDG